MTKNKSAAGSNEGPRRLDELTASSSLDLALTTTSETTSTTTYFPHHSDPLQSHEECIYSLALTASYIVTASRDHTVRVWSIVTQRLAYAPLRGHTMSALCVAVHESLGLIISGGVDCCLIIWNLYTGRRIRIIESAHSESILSIAVSDQYLATGSKDHSIKIWNTNQLALPEPSLMASIAAAHSSAVNALVITDSHLISGSGDKTIKIWDMASWTCIRIITSHIKGITSLALSPDGSKIISGSSDSTVRISDFETGAQEACLTGHTQLVRSVCLVPGDELVGFGTIISGSYDGSVVVWKKDSEGMWGIIKRFEVRGALEISEGNIPGSPRVYKVLCNGKSVFCANTSNAVVAWELQSGREYL